MTTKTKQRQYHCTKCGRKLKHEQWVYSKHTSSRYCLPGEGCHKPRRVK